MQVLSPLSGLGYGLAAQSANLTATNSTGIITLATFTVPASGWAVGDTYLFWSRLVASRGATATAANMIVELAIAGVVLRTLTLAIGTTSGTNRAADVQGLVSCRTLGAAGAAQTELLAYHDITGTAGAVSRAVDPAPTTAHPATNALDTTTGKTLELRARMSAAVAALTLYATHSGIHRLK